MEGLKLSNPKMKTWIGLFFCFVDIDLGNVILPMNEGTGKKNGNMQMVLYHPIKEK